MGEAHEKHTLPFRPSPHFDYTTDGADWTDNFVGTHYAPVFMGKAHEKHTLRPYRIQKNPSTSKYPTFTSATTGTQRNAQCRALPSGSKSCTTNTSSTPAAALVR